MCSRGTSQWLMALSLSISPAPARHSIWKTMARPMWLLPFRFNLFGVSSDQLCINNNGFMLLDWSKPCDGFYEDASIPNESVPLRSNQIAPFWDDLFTSGNVYYAVVGQEPNRRFIVQWHQKNHYNNGQSDPGKITFQAILDESTNAISFQYLDTTFDNPQHPEWDRGGSATVGFQSYVRDSFGGAWRSLPFHQPLLDSESGLTWPPTRFFHATASCDGDPQRPRSGYFGQPRGSGGNCPTGRLNFGSVYD